MIKVRVPATSANMGPGFDSIGIALTLYNYVMAEETDTGKLEIEILDDSAAYLPKDERNLIYASMKKVFDKVGYQPKGLHLVMENNIMVTRGLGSSSAGIVAGLVAANALSGYPLSTAELVTMAVEIEGHGDNVTPAILGGFTVNVKQGSEIRYVREAIKDDLRFLAMVPDFYLQTKKARGVLPKTVSLSDAVYNIGRSALLATSIVNGSYENLRVAVGDKLHQPYRKPLVPGMDALFDACYERGALAVYLSGAGPTLMAIVRRSDEEKIRTSMQEYLMENMKNWTLYSLQADNEGAVVLEG